MMDSDAGMALAFAVLGYPALQLLCSILSARVSMHQCATHPTSFDEPALLGSCLLCSRSRAMHKEPWLIFQIMSSIKYVFVTIILTGSAWRVVSGRGVRWQDQNPIYIPLPVFYSPMPPNCVALACGTPCCSIYGPVSQHKHIDFSYPDSVPCLGSAVPEGLPTHDSIREIWLVSALPYLCAQRVDLHRRSVLTSISLRSVLYMGSW